MREDPIEIRGGRRPGRCSARTNSTGAVELHDLATRDTRVLCDPCATTVGAACLAFAPDGVTLAVGQQDGRITLWDVGTGQGRQALSGHGDFIASLAFSPDGMTLASSSGDRSVRFWDLPAGRERFVSSGQTSTVTILKFSPDGRLLAMGDHISAVVRLWEVATGCECAILRGLAGSLVAVAISPDGDILAADDVHGLVTFWNLPTREIDPRQLLHAGAHSLAFAPDGRILATGGFDGTIQFWDWPHPSRD